MYTHDPFQSHQTAGLLSGGVSPFGLPIQALQQSIPAMGLYPQLPGLQQLQGLNLNPLLHQQQALAQLAWQNPMLAASLQNPLIHSLINPIQGYQSWPQQQQQQTFGYPLAPQSFIGGFNQGGFGQPGAYGQSGAFGQPGGFGQPGAYGQPFGQIHPLAQLALRQAGGYGINPYAGGCGF